MARNKYNPDEVTHPGESLRDVVRECGMNQSELAEVLDLSRSYISDLMRCTRGISLPLAIKLEKLPKFPSAEFWLTRQMHYDLWKARRR